MAAKRAVEGPSPWEGPAPILAPFSTTLTSMCVDVLLLGELSLLSFFYPDIFFLWRVSLSLSGILTCFRMNYSWKYSLDLGCFPLRQSFRKVRSEVKWKDAFRFLPTGIFGITSGDGPLISFGPVQPKCTLPFFTNKFIALLLFTYVGNSEKE